MNNFKKARLDKKLTQGKLSELIGSSRSSIAMWETGKNQPDNDNLCKLSEILGVTVDYLLGREEKKPAAPEGSELDEALIKLLLDLSPEEAARTRDFVAGLRAARDGRKE